MSEKSEDKMKDKLRRLEEIKRLDGRLKKLSTRKTNPMSAAAFCEKYDFNQEHICRLRKLSHIPNNDLSQRLSDALKKEKV